MLEIKPLRNIFLFIKLLLLFYCVTVVYIVIRKEITNVKEKITHHGKLI